MPRGRVSGGTPGACAAAVLPSVLLKRIGFAFSIGGRLWEACAAVFDEAPSVGAADGCALHKRVGRNFAGVRRLGDDVLSLPLCVCRRFEREYGSLCGQRLVRCARVQGGLCAGPAARFREASETKQTFRRCAGAGCERWGGFAVRPMTCASVLHLRAGRLHERLGLRLHGSGLYGWVCGERAEADVADGCTWRGRPCFRRRAAAWGRRAFLFRCVLAVLAKENAGSYASGALSAAPADKAAFRAAFARELRCGRRPLRSGVMFCADGAARRVCGRAVGRRRACFRPRGSKSAAKRGLKNMN